MTEIYWDNNSRQHLTDLLNAQTDISDYSAIMSYTERYADDNIQDPVSKQKYLDGISNILVPRSQTEVLGLLNDTITSLSSNVLNASEIFENPSSALKGLSKAVAGLGFANSIYLGIESIKQASPNDPYFESAKLYTQIGAGIIAGGFANALAANGMLGSLGIVLGNTAV